MKKALLLILFLSAASVFSCRRQTELPEDLVAQVNDHYLRLTDVNRNVPKDIPADLSLSLKKNIISKWVENETIYQMALKEGVRLDDYQQYLLAEYKKALIVESFLDQKLNRNYNISHREIENYYQDHLETFRRSEDEVHLIHLFMDQKDQAIFKEIRNAQDLMAIIKKYYFDEKSTISQPNGDLGYVPVSQLPEAFRYPIKRLKTGKISSPIKLGDGYHFIQLLDFKKKGTIRDLELVKDEIILRLKKQKRDQKYQELVQEAQQEVQIQTYLSKIQ